MAPTLAFRSVQPFGYGGGGGHDHHDPRPSGHGRFLGSISLAKRREAAERAKSAFAVLIGIVGAEGPITAPHDVRLVVETLDTTNVYTPPASRAPSRARRRRTPYCGFQLVLPSLSEGPRAPWDEPTPTSKPGRAGMSRIGSPASASFSLCGRLTECWRRKARRRFALSGQRHPSSIVRLRQCRERFRASIGGKEKQIRPHGRYSSPCPANGIVSPEWMTETPAPSPPNMSA